MDNMPFDERDSQGNTSPKKTKEEEDRETKEERVRVKKRAAARAARSEELRLLNGFAFSHNDKEYKIPCELLKIIFSHVNYESLLACHLVCKKWKALIQNHTWRMKAALTVHENFSHHHNVPWQVYHWICLTSRNPFEKNLLKNHSGENGLEHWFTLISQLWTVENPPVGVPKLPVDEDPIFEGKQFCFANNSISKSQTVDLVGAGFHPYILDNFRLPVELSEWYCGPEGYTVKRKCDVSTNKYNQSRIYRGKMIVSDKNKWKKMTDAHGYLGAGSRYINFSRSGRSSSGLSFKMAGACLKIKFPSTTAK